MSTESVAMTVTFLTISEELIISRKIIFQVFWSLCLKICWKEIKNMHHVTDSDTNIEIKIVLYFHPGTQIIYFFSQFNWGWDMSHIQLFWERLSFWSACNNPERYCGWFWVHRFSKKFERMAGDAMDIKSANAKGKEQK